MANTIIGRIVNDSSVTVIPYQKIIFLWRSTVWALLTLEIPPQQWKWKYVISRDGSRFQIQVFYLRLVSIKFRIDNKAE